MTLRTSSRLCLLLLAPILAWLAAAPAFGQLPGFPILGGGEEEGDTALRVQFATSDPREVVQRLKERLLVRQQAIIAAAPDLQAWQAERQRHVERLEHVRGLLVALRQQVETEEEETRAWKDRETRWLAAQEERRRLEAERIRLEAERAEAERLRRAAEAARRPDAVGGDAVGGDAVGGDAVGADIVDGDASPVLPSDAGTDGAGPSDEDDAGEPRFVAPPVEEPISVPPPAPEPAEPLPGVPEPGPTPGLTYPGYERELERLVGLLEVSAEELHYLVAGLAEERELVSSGIEKADHVLVRYEEKRAAADGQAGPAESVSLSQARSLSYDLYLARLELSLARSREGSLEQEREEPEETRDLETLLRTPPPLEVPDDPSDRTQETWQAARRVREDADDLATRLAQLALARRDRTAELLQTRLQVARVDVNAKEQRADQLSEELGAALENIRITSEDLEEEKLRFDSLSGKIAADIERVQSALEQLRAEPAPDGPAQDVRFSPAFVRELRLSALQEELTYHELRRERMHFVHETYTELHRMLRDEPPDPRYVERFARVLDTAEHASRVEEVGQRHEAWRRQHMQLQQKAAEPGRVKERRETLKRLLELVELCAKQEYALESEGRLADIVRYHMRRYELSARTVSWYVWRGILSLFILILAGFASVLLGRYALRFSRAVSAARAARLAEAADEQARAGASAPPGSAPSAWKPAAWKDALQGSARAFAFGVYFVGLLVLWFGAVVIALQVVWGIELGLARLDHVLEAPLFLVGDTQITLSSIARLLITIVLSVLVARLVHAFLERQVFQFFEWDQGVRHAVSAVLRYIVLFVGVSLGLEYVGLGLGAFAVLLGVVGIGIGFGLQNIANNFMSGFIILFERPVKKGDFVVAGELEGEVQTISARATTVLTRDNVSVIIPNSEFISGRVINWSHEDPRIRLRVPVGVAYGSDVRKVERLLLAVGRQHGQVLPRPRPEVWFTSFGDSSLNFELLVWTRNVRDRFRIVSDLNKAVDVAFRAENVNIPFPQRDLHIRTPLPAPLRELLGASGGSDDDAEDDVERVPVSDREDDRPNDR